MDNKIEKTKEVLEQVAEMSQLSEMESLVKNNTAEFEENGIVYRVRKPSNKEKNDLNELRKKKYMEYLLNDEFKLEEKLIEVYEKQGISINKINDELIALEQKHSDLLKRLATTVDKVDIDTLKNEILNIREDKAQLMVKKSEYLQYSIESQVSEYIQGYLTYLCLEKQEGDNWTRAFNSYDDFLNTDLEKVIIRGAYFLSILVYHNEV